MSFHEVVAEHVCICIYQNFHNEFQIENRVVNVKVYIMECSVVSKCNKTH